jgi:hypothetical protein
MILREADFGNLKLSALNMGDLARRKKIGNGCILKPEVSGSWIKQFGMPDSLKKYFLEHTTAEDFSSQFINGDFVEFGTLDLFKPLTVVIEKTKRELRGIAVEVTHYEAREEVMISTPEQFLDLLTEFDILDSTSFQEVENLLANFDEEREFYLFSPFPQNWLPLSDRVLDDLGYFLFVHKCEYSLKNIYDRN